MYLSRSMLRQHVSRSGTGAGLHKLGLLLPTAIEAQAS